MSKKAGEFRGRRFSLERVVIFCSRKVSTKKSENNKEINRGKEKMKRKEETSRIEDLGERKNMENDEN